jgi:hypothetical protein
MGIDEVQELLISSSSPERGSLRALRILHQEAEWRFWDPNAGSSPRTTCLTDPEGCEPDPYIVHLAVDDLCQLAAERILLEEPGDLGQFGLDPVSLTLRITTPRGVRREIYVGKQTPDGMSYYVQRAGDPRLYLVAQYTLQPFFEWLKEPPHQPPAAPTITPEPG